QAHQRGLAYLFAQEVSLRHFSVPHRVHAKLAQNQGSVTDQVLQAEKIATKRVQIVQVDIESDKVEEGKVQGLGGRIIGVGTQPKRIGLLGDDGQFPEQSLHATRAEVTNDNRREFIADAVREDTRMFAATFSRRMNQPAGIPLGPLSFQKTLVLRPGYINEYCKALLMRQPQKPVWRNVVGADRVDAD